MDPVHELSSLLITPLQDLKELLHQIREQHRFWVVNPPAKLIRICIAKGWIRLLERVISEYDTETAIRNRRRLELRFIIEDCERALSEENIEGFELGSVATILLTLQKAQDDLAILEGRPLVTIEISLSGLLLASDTHNM